MTRSHLGLAIGLALAGVVLTSPARAESLIRASIETDIRGLMPGMSPDVYTGTVLQQIYEGLVVSRLDGTVAPMLAETIDVSPDGRTYTFTLREGVTFHNGAPLTPDAVVWTWRQFLDPKRAWPCRLSFDGTRGPIKIEEVAAAGPRAVTFRLAAPSAAFLSMMARPDCEASIAHPDSVGSDGTWVKAIGTGPFMLTEWRHGQFVDLSRFASYRPREEAPDGYAGLKEAQIDRLRFLIIPDPNAENTALVKGEIDVWPQIDPKFAKDIKANPNLRLSVSRLSSINTLIMQTRDPVLADPRIRQAIDAAIDYPTLAEAISEGFAQASTSPVPASSRYFGPIEQNGHVYDLAKAKRLLAEAGYHGALIKITTQPRGTMFDTAIMVQAMLQEAGLNVEVEAIEFATMLSRSFKGEFQLMVWLYTPYLDPVFLFERFMGDKAQSPDRIWENKEALVTLRRLFDTADPNERQALFDDLHRRFIADAPMIVWSTRYLVTAMSKRVEGLEAWPGQRLKFWNVRVRE